jgi:hypothetical protein
MILHKVRESQWMGTTSELRSLRDPHSLDDGAETNFRFRCYRTPVPHPMDPAGEALQRKVAEKVPKIDLATSKALVPGRETAMPHS